MREHNPRLAAHLGRLGVDPAGPLPAWLLSGFVNCLPFEAAARVWDVACLERSPAPLIRCAGQGTHCAALHDTNITSHNPHASYTPTATTR